MVDLKRILVGLDLTEMDEVLIKYCSFFSQIMKPDKVYFIHISDKLELPKAIREKYPDLIAPVDETIQREIEFLVDQHFDKTSVNEISVEVKKGKPNREILKWMEIKEIDLIVLGRKTNMKGDGIIPGKIVKESHGSVMLVPEKSSEFLNKVVIPLNLGHEENLPLREALAIADKTHMRLIGQNIYHVPSGYHTTGKTFDEFAEIMKGNAQAGMEKLIKKYNLSNYNFHYDLTLDEEHDMAEKIYDLAIREHADMIIMGSQGRTIGASVLLRSVAAKLTEYDKNIPLLVVKDPKENLSFLEALMNI